MGQILDNARCALAACTRADAIAELEDDWGALEQRRQLRQAARTISRTHQCGGCRRFLRATNERCSCGFHNDIRGRRNVGGYA